MKRVSVLVVSSVLLAFSGSAGEAAQVESRNGCVNLRSQPSINSEVIRCLPSGTNLEPYRSPGSGRFTWQKEGDRVWYYTSVPGTSEKGWIMPVCTDINGTNQGSCTDTGLAAPLAKPQQPQTVAQSERIEEVLKNPSWKAIPGAAIGRPSRGFVDTLINTNSIDRQGNKITFDLTGRQSFYHRVQGDCSTRQVRLLRGGTYGADNKVYYRLLNEEDNNGVIESTRNLHRTALDFACKQSDTQIARSPAAPTTVATSAGPVGSAECSGIRGDNANTRPIQEATLEALGRGYTLRFMEIKQGQQIETVWQLDRGLIIEEAKTGKDGRWNLVPYNRQPPVTIEPTGKFSISMMVSSRSACKFAGTLQFKGNTQAQLFPGSSTQATNLSVPSSQIQPSVNQVSSRPSSQPEPPLDSQLSSNLGQVSKIEQTICKGTGRYVVFAQKPLDGDEWENGKIPQRGTFSDIHNFEQKSHEHIFFCDSGRIVGNAGFFPKRNEIEPSVRGFCRFAGEEIGKYIYHIEGIILPYPNEQIPKNFQLIDNKRYDSRVIDNILRGKAVNTPNYNVFGSNCQDFTDNVRKEYWQRIFEGVWEGTITQGSEKINFRVTFDPVKDSQPKFRGSFLARFDHKGSIRHAWEGELKYSSLSFEVTEKDLYVGTGRTAEKGSLCLEKGIFKVITLENDLFIEGSSLSLNCNLGNFQLRKWYYKWGERSLMEKPE
jgi:hypothetical protein